MRLGLGSEPSSSSAAAAALIELASENPNDSLFQVMKAVEAAEATIKQQVEENNRLRLELQNRNLLIEKLVSPLLSISLSISLCLFLVLIG